MNETLTELALDYGWGCETCDGTGVEPETAMDRYSNRCPDCHGNRVTPSDAEEFERLVVAVVRAVEDAEGFLSVSDQVYRETAAFIDLRQSLDSLQRKAE